LDICTLGGRVGARVGGARWVRGRMEREWNGRRGERDGRIWRVEREWDGGSGIRGLIFHADRRAEFGP
jgi:hypothetical protein